MVNEFDVQSILHWEVSLAAVNQIYVFHEAMSSYKNSNDSLKACFENVNIPCYGVAARFHCDMSNTLILGSYYVLITCAPGPMSSYHIFATPKKIALCAYYILTASFLSIQI